jgi:glycosyltransferase involved in cell wall biosynthesis
VQAAPLYMQTCEINRAVRLLFEFLSSRSIATDAYFAEIQSSSLIRKLLKNESIKLHSRTAELKISTATELIEFVSKDSLLVLKLPQRIDTKLKKVLIQLSGSLRLLMLLQETTHKASLAKLALDLNIETNLTGAWKISDQSIEIVVCGKEACLHTQQNKQSVLAIINVYNEIDILPETIEHLLTQGVDIQIVDNWSNDGSFEWAKNKAASEKRISVSRFPDTISTDYDVSLMLENSSRIGASSDYDWIIHHDADEIRISPWGPSVSLQEAITHIDSLGYNAIDFSVFDFRFLKTNLNPSKPWQESLVYGEFGKRPGHFLQIKCWKNYKKPVLLSSTGGHQALFEGSKIFPLKFLLRHYPLRGIEHALKKIFKERLPRYNKAKRLLGWHTQYDKYQEGEQLGWDANSLLYWPTQEHRRDLIVERLTGLGIVEAERP